MASTGSTDGAPFDTQPKGDPPRTLVIARYDEDLAWAGRVPWPRFVVQKERHLPNEGRESLSYLWYIIVHYHVLDGLYCFSQGSPEPHVPDMARALRDAGEPAGGFRALSAFGHFDDGAGWPLHQKALGYELPVDAFVRELFDTDRVPEHYYFPSGAFFLVTAERIRANPLWFYAKAFWMHYEYTDAPYIMERIWHLVFGAANRLPPGTEYRPWG